MTVSDASAEAYCGVRPNITDVCELSLCAAQTVTQPGLVSEACPDPTRLAGSVLGSDQGFSSATFLPQGSRRAVASIVLAMETLSASPEETESIAARLAAGLRVGDVVAVSGELGAGKTTFVRGAARALGVHEPVSSPTFTIGHRYAAAIPVAHLDLYRLAASGAEEWGDLEPYFDGTIAFVEWPENGDSWLPKARVTVTLSHVDPTHRRVLIADADDPRL